MSDRCGHGVRQKCRPLLGVSLYLENNLKPLNKQFIYFLNSRSHWSQWWKCVPITEQESGKLRQSLPSSLLHPDTEPSLSVPSILDDSSEILFLFISLFYYYYWWNIEYAYRLTQNLIFRNTPSLLLLQRFENNVLSCLPFGILSSLISDSFIHSDSTKRRFCIFLI